MSDKKHIDRIFQEGFKDFEAVPSDAVWKNIEAKLAKKAELDIDESSFINHNFYRVLNQVCKPLYNKKKIEGVEEKVSLSAGFFNFRLFSSTHAESCSTGLLFVTILTNPKERLSSREEISVSNNATRSG